MKWDQEDDLEALRRLLPVFAERDFPAGRREQREEHLMSGWLRMGNDRRKNGRQRRILRVAIPVAVAAAVATPVVLSANGAPGDATGGNSSNIRAVSAAAVLKSAAAEERKREETISPRDNQFIYTKEIVKETPQGGGSSKTYTDESWVSVDASKPSWVMELGNGFWNKPAPKEGVWPPRSWDQLEELPTDSLALIRTVRGPLGDAPSNRPLTAEDWDDVYFKLAGLLHRVPVMPEGLRPAAFEALSQVPGVKATPNETDAKGRPGVGVSKPGHQFGEGVIVFDAKTHAYLGTRDERVSKDTNKKYIQRSYLADYAVVDKAKQRP